MGLYKSFKMVRASTPTKAGSQKFQNITFHKVGPDLKGGNRFSIPIRIEELFLAAVVLPLAKAPQITTASQTGGFCDSARDSVNGLNLCVPLCVCAGLRTLTGWSGVKEGARWLQKTGPVEPFPTSHATQGKTEKTRNKNLFRSC